MVAIMAAENDAAVFREGLSEIRYLHHTWCYFMLFSCVNLFLSLFAARTAAAQGGCHDEKYSKSLRINRQARAQDDVHVYRYTLVGCI